MNSVMYVIVNNNIKMHNISMKKANWLKNQDAKPLTYVFPIRGGYGRRAAMEKSIFIYAGPPGQNYPVRRLS